MSNDEQNPLTLSREDLYELAWSKPISDLAKDFRISDVALAKRCRKLGIPVPGRGYWARFDAGQQPHRPKLPNREAHRDDHDALTLRPFKDSSLSGPVSPAIELADDDGRSQSRDQDWLATQLAFERLPSSTIDLPTVTRTWHPTIQIYRDRLEADAVALHQSRAASDRYEKWSAARKRLESCQEAWKWQWVKDRGERLCDTHKAVAIRVSLDVYKRALIICNGLAIAARDRGFDVHDDEKIGRITFVGHGAAFHFRVAELLESRTRPRVRYDGKTEQETYKVPTGRLRLTVSAGYREGPSFEDRESKSLDSQLNRVFEAIYRLTIMQRAKDREHKARELKLQAAALRREEQERAESERKRLLAEERARRSRLGEEADSWCQAQRIRDYVAHVRACANALAEADSMLSTWTGWALMVANEIDPTEQRLTRSSPSRDE